MATPVVVMALHGALDPLDALVFQKCEKGDPDKVDGVLAQGFLGQDVDHRDLLARHGQSGGAL